MADEIFLMHRRVAVRGVGVPTGGANSDAVTPDEGQRFQIDFDIKSVTESQPKSGTLVLEGYANTWEEDRDGETVVKEAFDHTIKDFMTNPILLLNHKKEQVLGGITHLVPDTTGLWTRAEVDKPPEKAEGWAHKAYADIKNGRLKTFSMSGLFHRSKGIGDKIRRVDLYEISVVTVPSNKTSLFRVVAEKGFAAEAPFRNRPMASEKVVFVMHKAVVVRVDD